MVSVPEADGLTVVRARTKVRAAELSVLVVRRYSHDAPGSVLTSRPPAGTQRATGSTVTLVVARPFPHVPSVQGMRLRTAKAKLRDAGYEVRTKIIFSRTALGTVISETPASGSELLPNKVVRLTTSSGCDKNYAGACLNPLASDYDCYGGTGDGPLYAGFVIVVGYDEFGLDGNDNDGRGCE